jgi:hypothetical protein
MEGIGAARGIRFAPRRVVFAVFKLVTGKEQSVEDYMALRTNRGASHGPRVSDLLGAETKSGSHRQRPSRLVPVVDETLIVDDRSELTPAQAVEDKLVSLLRDTSLPVSHLQSRGILRGRGDF